MRDLGVLVLLFGLTSSALAFSDADRTAVQSVLDQQLSAFSRDDGDSAYALAAPSIKQMFSSQEIFMGLVRRGYPPVYRQKSHAFAGLEEKDGKLIQSVDLVDLQGEEWTALYTLEQQGDGSWKITGCFLIKKPGVSA